MNDATLFDVSAAGGVLAGAVVSPCGTYRYTLDRVWDASLPTALFIMLNPSTADASVDDPTIRRCVSFAKRMGCGALTVVNLYALRSTDPGALATHPDPVGPDNDTHIALALGKRLGCVVAAWGAHPAANQRVDTVAALLAAHGWQVSCLGTTKGGAPRHPLYVRGDAPLTPLEPTHG
jgi:hypothetical protein